MEATPAGANTSADGAILSVSACVVRSGSGREVATVCMNPTATITELQQRIADVAKVPPHRQVILLGQVALSPDTTLMHAHVWDGAMLTLVELPDDAILIRCDYKGAQPTGDVEIWSARTSERVLTFNASAIWKAKFSPDGTSVLTYSEENTAELWSVSTGKSISQLNGHVGVCSIAFSADGTLLLTASIDGTAKIWLSACGSCVQTIHSQGETFASAAISRDATLVLTLSEDADPCLWSASSGELLTTLCGHDGVADEGSFSPDGTLILTQSLDDHSAKLWAVPSAECMYTFSGNEDAAVKSAVFSPDGSSVLTMVGPDEFDIEYPKIWSVATGICLLTLCSDADFDTSINSAAFAPDGACILTGSQGGAVKIWGAATGECLQELQGHASTRVRTVVFSPDGSLILAALSDGTVKLWSTANWLCVRTFIIYSHGNVGNILSADFSPNFALVLEE